MPKEILILPGDGVGKEITDAAASVLEAVTGEVEILYGKIGASAYEKTGYFLPPKTMELAAKSDAIIATPVLNHTIEKNYRDPLATLRKQLDMCSVLRKFQPLGDGIGVSGLDCMLINCNPQTVGTSKEVETLNGVSVESYIDAGGCRKVFRMGERIATAKQRRKITCLRDLELNPYSDAMFADLFYKEFAASEFIIDDMDVAEATSKLVLDPSFADVIVTPVPYSNAVSGVLTGMCGGAYLTCVGYLSENSGMFMPLHGPVEHLAGTDTVNPTGCILAGAMALDTVGLNLEADKIRNAVRSAYRKGMKTRDVGGDLSTSEFTYRVTKLCQRSR